MVGDLLNIESNKQHFRHILIIYYRKAQNAALDRKKIDVFEEHVDNDLIRPVDADKVTIKACVGANRRITIREIGESLYLSNSIVCDHLEHKN